ncbi:MptD family putative ECF transporter S component [Salipaludibacillus sp. LMS25]|jgi:energy-coupling factor transport system substrate-specific component|uniref:MptD family putative ECF transporter S component n=1 Tax=Salipaludibacillus sp. LMS25 TaxID=2924031 RepID=UPI0020D0BDFB|nr:MptD family putative ECF transporter S component [Salipaludibacillus sp. LMS25]UTR16545.1 MptD family putative ECF transporter S component [Salipaludibacillus sp. LMS25]
MSIVKTNKLTNKDLVTVGIYTAIYVVSMMVVGFLGFIPVFIPLMTILVPILGGIPFMLFLSKTKKFGMITLFSTINGIVMFVAGMGIYVAITGFVFGFLADLIVKSGQYESSKKALFGYCVFTLWLFGNFLPFYVGREAQLAMMTEGYGQEYVNALSTLMPINLAPVMFVACFIFALVGGVIGKAACKKHFERAGIL